MEDGKQSGHTGSILVLPLAPKHWLGGFQVRALIKSPSPRAGLSPGCSSIISAGKKLHHPTETAQNVKVKELVHLN